MLEVNPRGSRTFPFVAKSTGIPLARIAARITMGDRLEDLDIPERQMEAVAVKAPVFPFIKLRGLDPAPGPEMKSTGEVMGSADSFGMAYAKAELGAGEALPTQGTVFLSTHDRDKQALVPIAARLIELGFDVTATSGTAQALANAGLKVQSVLKVHEVQLVAQDPQVLKVLQDLAVQQDLQDLQVHLVQIQTFLLTSLHQLLTHTI